MIRQRCYQFRLRPTVEQEQVFRQTAGCRRFVWNYFLQRRQEFYLETGRTLSYGFMCKELTLIKRKPEFDFLNECNAQALQQVIRDLCRAYVNFFEKRARFPKFKSKKRTPNAFRIPQGISIKGESIFISKSGLVSAVLHRKVEGETKSATVKQKPSGKWNITLVSHFEAPEIEMGDPVNPVGIDAGLESFLTTSDGEKVDTPKFYRKQERKLRYLQRIQSRRKIGSNNRNKAKKKVALTHAKIKDQRSDWLHKCSRELCDKHDVICIEDLAVSSLAKTKLRGHSKSWYDAAWGEFRRQLTYKQEWKGRRLVAVSRWYPSSQECSLCKQRTKHDLSTRIWTCECCGTVHDRDHNSSKNILEEGLRIVAIGNVETLNVCGSDVRLPERKQSELKQKSFNREVRSPCI